jgi:hypothetical protein
LFTPQTDALVAYGLTYAFPVEDEADEGRTPRPAPLAPSIDTLHTYSALPQPVARFLGDKRAMKPGWAKGMPLMMRQLLAQRISTAVITRLEQVGRTRPWFVSSVSHVHGRSKAAVCA